MKKSDRGIVYVALYKDDHLMLGNVEVIDEVVAALNGNTLVLKVV